jgi:hypothetical protein
VADGREIGPKPAKPSRARTRAPKAPPPDPRVTFEALAVETDPLVVKQGLLRTLDQLYDACASRTRAGKLGEYADPDSSGAARAAELAARILGVIGVDPAVLIQFRNDTEKLVKRASQVLQERETAVLPKKE